MTRKRNLLVSIGIVLAVNKVDTILEKRRVKKLERRIQEEGIIIIKMEA